MALEGVGRRTAPLMASGKLPERPRSEGPRLPAGGPIAPQVASPAHLPQALVPMARSAARLARFAADTLSRLAAAPAAPARRGGSLVDGRGQRLTGAALKALDRQGKGRLEDEDLDDLGMEISGEGSHDGTYSLAALGIKRVSFTPAR